MNNEEIMMQSSSSNNNVGIGGSPTVGHSHYVTEVNDDVASSAANYNENDITITVMTTTGHEQHVCVSKDITVRKLKQLCIPKYIEEKRLNDCLGVATAGSGVGVGVGVGVGAASAGVSDEEDESRFKLIHTKSGKCLTDSKSLSDHSVAHSDSLILLPKKPKPPQYATLKATDGATRPSHTTISELTNSLPFKNESRCPRKDSNFNNYLSEMRKIILSLIHVSHRLLCYNKEAVDMFREATALLKANRAVESAQLQQSTSSFNNYSTSASSSSNFLMSSSTSRSAAGEGHGQGQHTTSSQSGSGIGSDGSGDVGVGDRSNGSHASDVSSGGVRIDPNLVAQLTDMGFKESLSKVALVVNEMNVAMATEWLLSNGDDESMLSALEPHPDNLPMAVSSSIEMQTTSDSHPSSADPLWGGPMLLGQEMGAGDSEPMDYESSVAAASHTNATMLELSPPNEGLKVLQEFHRLSFKPDAKALGSLIDMGFPAKDSHDALRINGNNQNLACEWLLSCPRKPSIEEWKRGIDANSAMYKAIVTNPLVQLLLNNPKILLALEDILDHPNSMSHYLNDPDAGPLLVQISSIYSTERHADGGGQNSGSDSSSSVTAATEENINNQLTSPSSFGE